MATNNCYDKLYDKMKNRLTVVDNSSEYTLGEYMQKKASIKKSEMQLQAVQPNSTGSGERAVAMLVSYVSDKLTVKETPAKDTTIKSFPFRASASALLSAVVACSFILSFCLVGARILATSSAYAPESVVAESEIDAEYETEEAKAE